MTTYGWTGKILRVNFTTGKITTENSKKYAEDYIGGMGFGYKIIYDEVPLDTHPYAEESKAVFAVGPLTATGVPCSGRMNISLLSSWSKGYSIVDAHMGGHISHAMKYAGYDAIIVEGKSSSPVYLRIEDDKVSIENASHLWGKGTFETNRMLMEENGREFDVASIGVAGEKMLNMSTLITSVGNSGGAGIGALLGSKNVKGFAIRGTGSVKVANPTELKELEDYMLRELIGANNNHNVPAVPQSWAEYSSPSGTNRWSGAPGRYWGKAAGGKIDTGEQPVGDINKIAYRTLKGYFDWGETAAKYMVKQGGCSSCPIRCYSEYDLDPLAAYDLPTKVSNTCMNIIFHTTWYVEGTKDFIDEGDAGIIINGAGSYAQDDFGLWCNYGNLLRDFNYLYKTGKLKELLPKDEWDSIPWQWMKDGDPRFCVEIMRRIAYREGELSHIGDGTYEMVKYFNLDESYYDVEYLQNVTYNGYPKHHSSEDAGQAGLLYNIMYNRDCMIHHLTNVVRSGAPYKVYKKTIEDEFGEGAMDAPKKYTPMNKAKAKLAKWAFNGKQWHDMAVLCNWMYPMTQSPSKERDYKGDHELDTKFMRAVTGINYTREEVDLTSERVSNMLRVMTAISFKIHCDSTNLRKDHDGIPKWVFDKEPDFKAFDEGTVKMDRDDMELAKDMFYEEMGWDKETGIPTRETLNRVGLSYMIKDLEKHGLI